MKKEYLSEEKYQNVKRILIIIGCISLLVGIALLVSSFLFIYQILEIMGI